MCSGYKFADFCKLAPFRDLIAMVLRITSRNLLKLQPILYGWLKLLGFCYISYNRKSRKIVVIQYAALYLVNSMLISLGGIVFMFTQIASDEGTFEMLVNPTKSKTIFGVEIVVTVVVIVYFICLRVYNFRNRKRYTKLLNMLESLSVEFRVNYARLFWLSNGGLGMLIIVHNLIRWPFYLKLYKTRSSTLLVIHFTVQSITVVVAELEILAVLCSLNQVLKSLKLIKNKFCLVELLEAYSKFYQCCMLVHRYYGFPFLLALSHQLIWTVIYFYKTLIANHGLTLQTIILRIIDPFWGVSTALIILIITYFDRIMKQVKFFNDPNLSKSVISSLLLQANETVLCTRNYHDYNVADNRTTRQINKFLLKNLHQKKKFSAYGFFDIDNSVIYMVYKIKCL